MLISGQADTFVLIPETGKKYREKSIASICIIPSFITERESIWSRSGITTLTVRSRSIFCMPSKGRTGSFRKRSLKKSIIPFHWEWLRNSFMTLVTSRSVCSLFPAAFPNGIPTESNGTGSLPGNRGMKA